MSTQTTTKTYVEARGSVSNLTPPGGRDVHTTMNFLDDSVHLDYPLVPMNGLVPKEDHKLNSHPVLVKDIRGKEGLFTLDVNGFQLMKHKSAVKPEDLHKDDKELLGVFHKECEELYKKALGATRVFIIGHLVRHGPLAPEKFNTGPVRNVHIDQSMAYAEEQMRMLLPEGEPDPKRWALVNIWRPIKTIRKDPFAVMDFQTIQEQDLRCRGYSYKTSLVKINGEHNTKTSETGYPLYRPDYQFWYKSLMEPDEVKIFKIADSDHSKAWCVAHSSFPDEEFANEPDRESIETRAICVWD